MVEIAFHFLKNRKHFLMEHKIVMFVKINSDLSWAKEATSLMKKDMEI